MFPLGSRAQGVDPPLGSPGHFPIAGQPECSLSATTWLSASPCGEPALPILSSGPHMCGPSVHAIQGDARMIARIAESDRLLLISA